MLYKYLLFLVHTGVLHEFFFFFFTVFRVIRVGGVNSSPEGGREDCAHFADKATEL